MMTMLRVVSVLLVGATWVLWSQAQVLAGDRALLIGIERYAWVQPTPGCEADAREMAELLCLKFGFPEASVKVLINDQATARAIRSEFKTWLIDGTRPGDRVFFLYAGHGSQVPDDNGDEADHLDETIVPFDAQPEGTGQLRDDEFEGLIKQLSDRRGVFVFDSCHSGTISRGTPKLTKFPDGGGARYLPRPDQLPERSRSYPGSYTISSLPRSRNGIPADGFITSSRSGSGSATVIISAAQSDQTAFPIAFKTGQFRGALSFAIEQVLTKESQIQVKKLEAMLTQQIAGYQKNGVLAGDQVPVVEVLGVSSSDGLFLFGTGSALPINPAVHSQPLTSPATLTNPFSKETVTIRTTTGTSIFRVGDALRYEISSSFSGYLYVIAFSPQNVATVLFPTQEDTSVTISAGTQIFPPAHENPIRVQPPFGQDIVVAIVSARPIHLVSQDTYTWQEIFDQLQLKEIQEALSRALKHKAVWQAGSVMVETKP